ncbi:oxidoreductase [Nocardioides sp. URHA0020]|uniref:oxidoreductase n=1 Tax=Nocardioides sp. URHA0020 TaxID=1380392 RepID=UPI00048C5304|nr:oxidoreductase [Nocardioides sp. URHA0020]
MPRRQPWDGVPPQDGRRFVVTGGSGGLGLATARVLAERGAEVVLAVRNPAKGEAAAATLPGSVEVRRLDVADLTSVRAFAADIGPVDVLINNAGVLAVPYALTVDGFETHLATNHLGHFALTNLLLPQLRDRVVVISSDAHRAGSFDLRDLNWQRRTYKPFGAYGASKLANLLFLGELQRRLTAAGSTLRAVGSHPGSTATSITANTGSPFKTWVGSWGHRVAGMPVWKGALTTLYAATMDVPGNSFIGPDGFRELTGWPTGVGRSREALDPDLARGLWAASEELTGIRFPLG